MTTPTPSGYWIKECIKIAASAGNLDAAENARRELNAAQEAIRYLVDHQGHFQTKHAPAIDAAMRKP